MPEDASSGLAPIRAGGSEPGAAAGKAGERDPARAAFERAIESWHAEQAPMAANNLGVLLEGRGTLSGPVPPMQAIDSESIRSMRQCDDRPWPHSATTPGSAPDH